MVSESESSGDSLISSLNLDTLFVQDFGGAFFFLVWLVEVDDEVDVEIDVSLNF